MSLLSNSLFLDSEYKADCEFKINYLNIIKNNKAADATFNDDNNDNETFTANISDGKKFEKNILTRVIEADEKPIFSDGSILYNTKNISENYYKILFELENNN